MTQLLLERTADAEPTLLCGLTPSGRIELDEDSAAGGAGTSAAVHKRITAAFDTGRGHGVLQLGAAELDTELHPTLAYFRDIGRAVVARVCAGLDPMHAMHVMDAMHAMDPMHAGARVVPEPAPGELEALVQAVPPMRGAELLTVSLLAQIWREVAEALAAEAAGLAGGVQEFLSRHNAVWHVVGRVCLHLAENRRDPDYPFAFMATYVHRVSQQARPQHLPLGRALEEHVGARDRKKLLSLLAPLSRAAEQSRLIRELFDSGDIYHPLAWTAAQAHRFLCEAEQYEQAGLVVKMPDWWNARKRPRPRVSVAVGSKAPSLLGMDALLDFDVKLTLGGVRLSKQEVSELLASTQGLVLLKGRWVEVDRERLHSVLGQWQALQARARAGGVSFGEAMRLLSGAQLDESGAQAQTDDRAEWSEVVAGKWLQSRLAALRSPGLRAEIGAGAGLRAELRPYQKLGVQWLWTLRGLGLGGCLADDMGLGKTIQVIAVLALGKRKKEQGTDLLVVPASLVDNWRLEIERFAPELRVLIAHPSAMPASELKQLSADAVQAHDVVLTTYGTAMRHTWIKSHAWRSVVLDEAQAIKNPGAKQTRAVKALDARFRLALTGTPVENHLGDLWSIFDFINPGLLGSAKAFNRLCKVMASGERGGYAPLRRLVQPYILRRLKTDKTIIADLPDKSEVVAYCPLSKRQIALYTESVEQLKRALQQLDGIERRGTVLAFLMRFKQICNHPSQWLGDGAYEAGDSGKLGRLRELCESIAARQDKVLVFTQFREMTAPLAGFLGGVFGRRGLVLHGGTPVKQRQSLVQSFQQDERVPFMVLSLKAGGAGLNLTAASHVIHFDRWWNAAVEDQATDRAYRIGQQKNVLVHKFVCRGTVEERIDALITSKRKLGDDILSRGAESALTEMSDDELLSMVSLDLRSAVEG